MSAEALRTAKEAADAAFATLDREIRNARREGMSLTEIGDALGVSRQAVSQRLGRRGEHQRPLTPFGARS